MTRAMRLVVVWMAGALALAIGYRVHVLRDAEPPPPVASLPLALPLPPPLPFPLPSPPEPAITDYLRAHYDEIEHRDDGYVVTGLAYIPAEAPLVEIDNRLLRDWFLPDTRFFKTEL